MKMLEQFGEDMVLRAPLTEPVSGRDKEIEEVIAILCRKNKNNPALIGEPGVGKTAVAEGLAQRIAVGSVPQQLRHKRLFNLSMANLVAGTKYRGEFEERLRDLVAEIQRMGDIILFIDEMHTIVGAGAAEGAIDASNILKPALGRGQIQMLGATTYEEYHKWIEKDKALERRFRPVQIEEPNRETALGILRGLRGGLERHHGLKITDGALEASVDMSVRYLPELRLPDKAIDLIDEAAANVSVGGGTVVDGDRIADAVCRRTGIPVGQLTADRRKLLLHLEEALEESLYGQSAAVAQVAKLIRTGLSDLRDPKKPVSSLLLSGPTGVGKTELCRVLAKTLFGSGEALIRFDMSEYTEKQSAAGLIGAPPGYVGYEDGGRLTAAVKRRPYCIVLLDEIEKAHPDVSDLLLQISEEGELTDQTGTKVSFRNAIIILTTNLGARQKGEGLGFRPSGRSDGIRRELEGFFKPELLSRLDGIVYFSPLDEDALCRIAQRYLDEVCARLCKQGVRVELPADLPSTLCRKTDAAKGARGLRNLVRTEVEEPLAQMLLQKDTSTDCIQWCQAEKNAEFETLF